MPSVPKPKKGEKSQAYISRIIEMLIKSGRDKKQAAAIAYDVWRRHNRK